MAESLNQNTGVVRRISFSSLAEDENLRGFLRIKPISIENITDEINRKHYLVDGQKFISVTKPGRGGEIHNEYCFNGILMPTASQEDVFDVSVRDRLEEVLNGEDTFIFAYGTTSSGKSYTVQGTGTKPGIIPRSLYTLFTSIGDCQDIPCILKPCNFNDAHFISKRIMEKENSEKLEMLSKSHQIITEMTNKSSEDSIRVTSFQKMEEILQNLERIAIDTSSCKYSIWLSFIEVYNECIYDLFEDTRQALKIYFDVQKNPYIKNVKYMLVTDWEEAYQLYVFAKHNLHVSSTTQNRSSSRSHCVLTVKVVRRFLDSSSEDDVSYNVSSFHICDLAGSERQRIAQNTGARLKESQSINTSLLRLNRCFDIIRSNQRKRPEDRQMVPFRDSKLTLLFKNALVGGECHTTMITNISQSDLLISETQQVLKATAVAMNIITKPKPKLLPSRRRSVFYDRQIVRQALEDPVDEGTSSLECQACLALQRENDSLREVHNTSLALQKEEYLQKERALRKELCDGFNKLLDDSNNNHKKRLDQLKKDHIEELNRTRRDLKRHFELKLQHMKPPEPDPNSSFVQVQLELRFSDYLDKCKAKTMELANLLNVDHDAEGAGNDLNENISIMEKMIRKLSEDISDRREREKTDANRIDNLQMELEALKNELATKNLLAEKFAVIQKKMEDCIAGTDQLNTEVVPWIEGLVESNVRLTNELKKQEDLFARGAQDYAHLENELRNYETDIAKLEEEVNLKESTISQLMDEVKNLTLLLQEKSEKQDWYMDAGIIPALGKLKLSDGREDPVLVESPATTRKSRRIRKNSEDDSGDDPSFVIPKRKAVTSMKKKKPKNKNERSQLRERSYWECPLRGTSPVPSTSPGVAEVSASGSTHRRRRKLFPPESGAIGDTETLQLPDLEVAQLSPNSYMNRLRPKK